MNKEEMLNILKYKVEELEYLYKNSPAELCVADVTLIEALKKAIELIE